VICRAVRLEPGAAPTYTLVRESERERETKMVALDDFKISVCQLIKYTNTDELLYWMKRLQVINCQTRRIL
jgi:hypothetical protein